MNSLPRNCTLARAKLHDAITTTHRFANDLTQQRLEEGALPPPTHPKKNEGRKQGRAVAAVRLSSAIASRTVSRTSWTSASESMGCWGAKAVGLCPASLGLQWGALQATLGRRSSAVHEQHNGGQNGATAILMTQCCSDEKWLG